MASTQQGRAATGGAVLRRRLTDAITEAALAELAETGYARMSMEAVARRAGAGKAALYRRWPSKQAMLADLIRARTADVVPPAPDTGALHSDLRELLTSIRDQLSHPFVAQVGLGLLAEARHDDVLAEVLDAGVAAPRRELARGVLQRAVERGELSPDTDLRIGVDLIVAPLAFRILVTREESDDDYLDTLTDTVDAALRSHPADAGRRRRSDTSTG